MSAPVVDPKRAETQINQRLSLRKPQSESLHRLADIVDLIAPSKDTDVETAREAIRAAMLKLAGVFVVARQLGPAGYGQRDIGAQRLPAPALGCGGDRGARQHRGAGREGEETAAGDHAAAPRTGRGVVQIGHSATR